MLDACSSNGLWKWVGAIDQWLDTARFCGLSFKMEPRAVGFSFSVARYFHFQAHTPQVMVCDSPSCSSNTCKVFYHCSDEGSLMQLSPQLIFSSGKGMVCGGCSPKPEQPGGRGNATPIRQTRIVNLWIAGDSMFPKVRDKGQGRNSIFCIIKPQTEQC